MPALPQEDLDHVLEHTRELWEDLRDQSIFFTGGTGFVGTWLLESFVWCADALKLSARVVVLTRDSERFRTNAPHLATHPAVRVLRGDVAGFAFPDGQFPFVIHAATERIAGPDEHQPLGSFERDVEGTRRVLEFARAHGTRRLLFTSSGAVYGRQPPGLSNVGEDYPGAPSPLDVEGTYAHAKRVSEFMCAAYGRAYRFDALIARLFAFVGPLLPLNANYAVGNFIRDALDGGPIRIAGDGTPYRSYLYASDLAIWLWTILLRGQAGVPYNVGSSKSVSIAELARAVANAVAPETKIEVAGQPVPGMPPLRYVPETLRAENELDLRASIALGEGIRRTAQWHRLCARKDAQAACDARIG